MGKISTEQPLRNNVDIACADGDVNENEFTGLKETLFLTSKDRADAMKQAQAVVDEAERDLFLLVKKYPRIATGEEECADVAEAPSRCATFQEAIKRIELRGAVGQTLVDAFKKLDPFKNMKRTWVGAQDEDRRPTCKPAAAPPPANGIPAKR